MKAVKIQIRGTGQWTAELPNSKIKGVGVTAEDACEDLREKSAKLLKELVASGKLDAATATQTLASIFAAIDLGQRHARRTGIISVAQRGKPS